MGIYYMLNFVGILVPLVVIVGIVAAVVVLMRRRGRPQEEDSGIGTIKRVYYYGLSFIALGVAAPGLIVLLDFLLDNLFGPPALSRSQTQLALGLALTLVGTPIWFLHWWLSLRAVQRLPAEAMALSRKIYLYLVLGITAALTAVGLVFFLRWLLGSGSFNGYNIALPLVWGGVWAYHWHIQAVEDRGAEASAWVRRFYWYFTSLYGLVMLATGVGIVIWRPLRAAYETLFTTKILLPGAVSFWDSLWTDAARTGVAIALVGGVGWWWHWHRAAKGDVNSVLRQVYLYLFAILGGAATVVVALSSALIALVLGSAAAYALTRFHYRPRVGSVMLFLGCLVLMIVLVVVGLPWQLALAVGLAVFLILRQALVRRFKRSLKNRDVAFWMISQRMLPPVAVVIPIYVLFQRLGLLDTHLALIITYVAGNLPIVIWLMRDYFSTIPVEVEECAAIDGASRYRIFWSIVVPLAVPGLVATFLFILVFAWNEYLLAVFLSSAEAQTLPLIIAAQNSTRGPQWWYMSVLTLIMILPVVGIAIALERYIARGLLIGAVKG